MLNKYDIWRLREIFFSALAIKRDETLRVEKIAGKMTRNPMELIFLEKPTISFPAFWWFPPFTDSFPFSHEKVYSVVRQLKISKASIFCPYELLSSFFIFFLREFEISRAGEDWSLISRFSWGRWRVELVGFWKTLFRLWIEFLRK